MRGPIEFIEVRPNKIGICAARCLAPARSAMRTGKKRQMSTEFGTYHLDRATCPETGADIVGLIITQVDTFTNTPFTGNPAAVCLMPEAGNELWMQHVAQEVNLVETAFLHPQQDGFHLRWFT